MSYRNVGLFLGLIFGFQAFGQNAVSDDQQKLVACQEALDGVIGGTIVESTAVVPYALPESSHQSIERKNGFKMLARLMNDQANRQNGVVVNKRRVSRFTLKGKGAFKALRAFHLNPEVGHPGDRHRRVFIGAELDYQGTRSNPDPKDKSKIIETHSFKKQVSENLVMMAVLIQENTPQGLRLDRLIVRLVERKGDKVSQVEIPLMYNYFNSYRKLDRNMNLEDEGYGHQFNSDMKLEIDDGQIKEAIAFAVLNTSFVAPNPDQPLSISIAVMK